MRAAARDLGFSVSAADDPKRVRMRLGTLMYVMSLSEAVALATGLADAVEQLREGMTNE
jgi:hypothetical protein